jgi:uncharacterized protein
MRKYSFLFLGAFILGLISCNTTKVKQDQKLDNALLWEVKGKGITKPSYVYGTIHMIPSESYFLPKGTLSAVDNCEELFFEIDMKDMSDMNAMMGMMNKIFMKDGLTLKDLLSETDYKLVNDYFSKLGLPMFMMEKIKPMFLSAFAMADMNPASMKEGKVKSYEMEFYEIAKNKNMSTGGLETIEFQISVFDSIPYKDQAKMLVDELKNQNGEADNSFKEMVKIYKDQNINAMYALMQTGDSSLGEHEDILLTGRNTNWIPQIIAQAKMKPTFFAVGAGHLGGPMGVINLLKKQGLKVTAVK